MLHLLKVARLLHRPHPHQAQRLNMAVEQVAVVAVAVAVEIAVAPTKARLISMNCGAISTASSVASLVATSKRHAVASLIGIATTKTMGVETMAAPATFSPT
jgi:hypothetical protein